jgi:hypothetical protein
VRKAIVRVVLPLFLLALVFMGAVLWPPAGMALGGYDVRGLFVPWLEWTRTAVWQGHLPFWQAGQFAGYPFLSNPQVALFYPPTWLAILLPVRVGLSWGVLFHLVVAGLGMWLFVYQQSQTRLGAWLAAITYAFGGFTAARLYAGHVGLLATFAWLPWLLWAFAWSVKRRSAWTAVLPAIPFALSILAGHTTSLLYVGLVWGAWAVFLGTGGWRVETGDSGASSLHSLVSSLFFVARQFLIAFVVGLLLSGVQLLPLAQFAAVSARSGTADFAFASAYSFPPAHLVTLLTPEFFGEPTRAGYWSVPNFEELTYYAGVLSVLAVALAGRRPSRRSLFYLALMFLGLMLALGSYGFLYRIFYDWLPPFRLARAPGRAMVLYAFAAAALLGEVVGEAAWPRPSLDRLMRWLLAGTAVLGLTIIAATGAVFMAVHPTETSGRLWHQLGGWGTAVLLLLIGGVLLWRFLALPPDDGRRRWLALALIALAVVDLWWFGYKFVRLESTAVAPLWPDTVALIGTPEERILPWGVGVFEQNGAWQVGLNSVFGYNALEIGANQAFTGAIPDPRSTAYDILAARYVVAPVPLDNYSTGERPLTLVGNTGAAWVYERARAFPLARLVSNVEVIGDEAAAIARVHQADFDPATTVILDAAPPCELGEGAGGTAVIREQRDGYWQIETDSAAASLLVLSETDYPGWRVTVDGQPAQSLTAYTTIRAVCVPAGAHVVEWRFVPMVYGWGGLLTLVGLVVVGTAVWQIRRRER